MNCPQCGNETYEARAFGHDGGGYLWDECPVCGWTGEHFWFDTDNDLPERDQFSEENLNN